MRTLAMTAIAAVATGAFAAPAMAQDIPFNGPRIGVIAGYDGIRPGSSEDSDIDGDDQTVDGFQYGVDAGYDVNLGSAVIGVEGEVADSTGKVDPYDGDASYFGYGRVKTGRDLYLGVRAGALVNPSTLVYGKVGYTNARLDITAQDGETETGNHFNLDGYRVGAGVEHQFNGNLYAKIEYRYSNYGDARLEYANGDNTDNFDVDTDRHQVVAGVGMRF
ncbi:outer membrane beta-barrel protein [Stakelama sp. CBK3Z-3]|uniref:Outer membrane beta-barrel protein n=1 Tax=Stakelama flava TaxID=2860338 RepID=A0ABS6XM08_9SPHN|nr:outer membrane beta-barrel protein [Stakelama flava]MBW4331253.1 outer membrane beta-barrel protein [Stakelama flava]